MAKKICRRFLMGGPNILGNQTTSMFRMAAVKARERFYVETSVNGDADTAVEVLCTGKFGFVHEVLSVLRMDRDSLTISRQDFDMGTLTRRVLLEKYGERFLDAGTLAREKRRRRFRHLRAVGKGLVLRKSPEFWKFHRDGLKDAGLELSNAGIAFGAAAYILQTILNIESTFHRFVHKFSDEPHLNDRYNDD